MEPVVMRPLRLGESLDVAINLYRRNFKTLVTVVAIVVTPVQVLSTLVMSSSRPDFEQLGADMQESGTDPSATFDGLDFGPIWRFLAGMLVVGLLSFVASQLASAASMRTVSEAYLGREVTWQESLQFATSRLGSLVWLAFVQILALVAGFVLCVIPGIYLFGAFAVATPALLLENQRGSKALGRSRQLVRGRWWQVSGALFLAFLLSSLIQGVLTALVVGVTLTQQGTLANDVANLIGGTASSVLATPFIAAVTIVIYFDLRVRKEGYDLLMLAQQLGVDPPEDHPLILEPPPLDPDDQPPFWPPPPGWRPRDPGSPAPQ